MKQLLVAESEKRMHVTKFFGGGRGQPFAGETREIIGSPRLVESYDLKPEMHAAKIAQKVVAAIQSSEHDLIVVNLANADLVAQTGDIEATVAAVEAIDSAIGAIAAAVHAAGGALLITSDHGNAEQMLDTRGTRSGAHTTNPVPLFFVCADRESKLRSGGDLTDVAPTILELLGIARPPEMTGTSLLVGP
jgi:2,3-bisphosphoglycerate-independent phosphoglycerate mutase